MGGIDQSFARKLRLAAAQRTFRGEIWEDGADVPMGLGYANQGKPFDIGSACYLRPVFAEIRNPNVRKVVNRAAVQTLKTFATEKSAAYFAVHDPGDMAIYDCDIEAAADHAKSRMGPFLKSLPGLREQVEAALAQDRHKITTTEFYLPGMTLRFWPLNASSTQRITLRYVFISDAFLSKKTGMIGQAIARTTQHPADKKIIVESQGSDAGDDFDAEWLSTDQRVLHVACPFCRMGQPFDWERERGTDFVAAPMGEGVAVPGRFSGMIRGDASPDREKGEIDEAAVLAGTHYECYYCGAKWPDTPPVRKALDESSFYVATNPKALPENVGFSWPAWINQRLPWGQIMLEYLRAKRLDREYGNREPLKIWWQKRAALTWNENVGRQRARVIVSTADGENRVENEAARMMMVDCQQNPDLSAAAGQSIIGHFWYIAWAVDKQGRNIHQIARGYAKSWLEWIEIRKRLKISNKNVAVDGGHWLHDVLDFAAQHWEIGHETVKGRKIAVRHVWTVMRGNGVFKSRKGKDGIWRAFTDPSYFTRMIEVAGKKSVIQIPVIEWSNLSIKDHLHAIRMGGPNKPKMHALPRSALDAQTQAKETGPCTYDRQIANEVRTRTKGGKDIWEEIDPNVHYNDCECMGIVQCGRGGLLGIPAAPEEAVAEV